MATNIIYPSMTSKGTTGADTLYDAYCQGGTYSIDGLGGTDTFQFLYAVSSTSTKFTLTNNANGSVTISGASNGHSLNVTLTNFEQITYSDKTVTLSGGSSGNTATSGNDTLTGTTAANTYDGLGGNDNISGLDGNDILKGNTGNDTLDGGTGNDNLNGGAGVDKLYGGTGNDVLYGGTQADVFIFNTTLSSTSNVDSLRDFATGGTRDKFALDDDIFTGFGQVGTVAGSAMVSTAFYAGKSAHDANDHIIYDKATGGLYYDVDGQGGTAMVKFATVGTTTHPTLTAGDFLILA